MPGYFIKVLRDNNNMGKSIIGKTEIEKKPIVWCALFNIAISAIIFVVSLLVTRNQVTTVIYTMTTWTVTVFISTIFWVWWMFKKTEALLSIKVLIAFIMVLIMVIGLEIVWSVVLLYI